jgi:cytochrome c551
MAQKKRKLIDSSKMLNFCFGNSTFLVSCLLAVLSGCGPTHSVEEEQYLVAGEELYVKHCANCHGREGEGLKRLYPPLKGSDFLINKQNAICIIKHGSEGPLKVNGVWYNAKMPKNKALYDLDIAQISTYIFHKWGKGKGITRVEEVKKIQCTIAE